VPLELIALPPACDGRLWRLQGDWRRREVVPPTHRHRELEANLVHRGHGHYVIGDRRLPVRAGDLLWLFPDQEHMLVAWSRDFAMDIAVFRPALVAELAVPELEHADPGAAWVRRLDASAADALADSAERVAAACDHDHLRANRGRRWWRRQARDADRAAEAERGEELHPAVLAAVQLLHADPGRGLAELAAEAGLSPSRLSRLFAAQMGMPLTELRNRRRLELFFAHYGSGQRRTMLDAALAAGFGSYAQFHRVFRRLQGCSPATYRRRYLA